MWKSYNNVMQFTVLMDGAIPTGTQPFIEFGTSTAPASSITIGIATAGFVSPLPAQYTFIPMPYGGARPPPPPWPPLSSP